MIILLNFQPSKKEKRRGGKSVLIDTWSQWIPDRDKTITSAWIWKIISRPWKYLTWFKSMPIFIDRHPLYYLSAQYTMLYVRPNMLPLCYSRCFYPPDIYPASIILVIHNIETNARGKKFKDECFTLIYAWKKSCSSSRFFFCVNLWLLLISCGSGLLWDEVFWGWDTFYLDLTFPFPFSPVLPSGRDNQTHVCTLQRGIGDKGECWISTQ